SRRLRRFPNYSRRGKTRPALQSNFADFSLPREGSDLELSDRIEKYRDCVEPAPSGSRNIPFPLFATERRRRPVMQAADSEFHQLLRDIQLGREEAARKLVDRYGSALLRVIRRRLDPRLRQQFDSIDFLQEALATFLCQPPAPEAFDSAEALF